MDSITFFKTIKYPDFPNDISKHFEESMALYNLLKGINHQDITVIAEIIDPDSINFNIKTNKQTRDMTEHLVDCYGTARNYYTNYTIEVTSKTKSSICIHIERASRT